MNLNNVITWFLCTVLVPCGPLDLFNFSSIVLSMAALERMTEDHSLPKFLLKKWYCIFNNLYDLVTTVISMQYIKLNIIVVFLCSTLFLKDDGEYWVFLFIILIGLIPYRCYLSRCCINAGNHMNLFTTTRLC